MGNKDLERSQIALQNSILTVSIYHKGNLIAFGRVAGDGGITYVVSDIMVDKNHRRKGLADMIMKEIDSYFLNNTYEDSFIFLIANSPADIVYSKYNFQYLSENRYGMLRNQNNTINKL